ncbi:hypothetical protein [Nonomuraea longicatena]|uniref:Uncharacterized protein n=1 Tax=Nonomuraea longicatena TaxID=83682 RepID=A0ABP4A2F8_9ACTN
MRGSLKRMRADNRSMVLDYVVRQGPAARLDIADHGMGGASALAEIIPYEAA